MSTDRSKRPSRTLLLMPNVASGYGLPRMSKSLIAVIVPSPLMSLYLMFPGIAPGKPPLDAMSAESL